MKSICLYVGIIFLSINVSCSKDKKTNKETITIGTKKKGKTTIPERTTSVPILMDNKGIGPIQSLIFADNIDQNLAAKGKQLFKSKCTACHKASQRFIGPAMTGIYKVRSPEWVMNMIMNPDEMLKKDPVAMALLKEYNNTIMINQNIPEKEARAIVEWFRTLE